MRWLLAVAVVALGACDESGQGNAGKEQPAQAPGNVPETRTGDSTGTIEAHGYVLVDDESLGSKPDGGVSYGTLAEAARVGEYDVPKGTTVAFDDEGHPTRMYHPDETLQIGSYPSAPHAIVELRPDGRATLFCLAEDRRVGDNYYAAGTALSLEPDGSVGRVPMTYYTHPGEGPKALRVRLPREHGCDPDGRKDDGRQPEPAPELNRERWRETMRAAVQERLSELDPCLAEAPRAEAKTLTLWAQVDESGRVTAVDFVAQDADELAKCIDARVRRWSFDVGPASGADISASFVLAGCTGARACMEAWKKRARNVPSP